MFQENVSNTASDLLNAIPNHIYYAYLPKYKIHSYLQNYDNESRIAIIQKINTYVKLKRNSCENQFDFDFEELDEDFASVKQEN